MRRTAAKPTQALLHQGEDIADRQVEVAEAEDEEYVCRLVRGEAWEKEDAVDVECDGLA